MSLLSDLVRLQGEMPCCTVKDIDAVDAEVEMMESRLRLEEDAQEETDLLEATYAELSDMRRLDTLGQAYAQMADCGLLLSTVGMSKPLAGILYANVPGCESYIEDAPDLGDVTAETTTVALESLRDKLAGIGQFFKTMASKAKSVGEKIKEWAKKIFTYRGKIEALTKELAGKKFDIDKFKTASRRVASFPDFQSGLKNLFLGLSAVEECIKEVNAARTNYKSEIIAGKSFRKLLDVLQIKYGVDAKGNVNLSGLRIEDLPQIPPLKSQNLSGAGWVPAKLTNMPDIPRALSAVDEDFIKQALAIYMTIESWMAKSAWHNKSIGFKLVKDYIQAVRYCGWLLNCTAALITKLNQYLDSWVTIAKVAKSCIIN